MPLARISVPAHLTAGKIRILANAVHEALVDEGLHVTWREFPGPHEAEYWIEHVPDYLRFYSSALGD